MIRHGPKLLEATVCQRDPNGDVLFQHRNGAKWILDGINPRIGGFRLEAECRMLLEELARLWDGRIFNPPPRSDEAKRLEAELARIREFTLTRVSSDERRIALLPDHRIRSHHTLERYWYIADCGQEAELRIEADGLQVCALRRSAGGTWRGRLSQPPGMPVVLVAATAGDANAAGEAVADRSGGRGLMEVLDRILEAAASLPWDREVERDFVGALRILAALDPALRERLEGEERRWSAASARARAIRAAFDGLAGCGAVAPGSGWLDGRFRMGRGYERA